MFAYVKRYWHKVLCVLCALAVVFVTVFTALSPAVYADDGDSLPFVLGDTYSFDDWNTVPDNLKNLANAYVKAFSRIGTYEYFGAVLDIPKAWVHTATDLAGQIIYTIVPVDGLFYWLDNGKLTCYDSNNRTSHGGGGGKNRYTVSDGDTTVVSGEDFRDICSRLEEQYSPKNSSNRHSWRTDKAFVANGYGYLSFFSEGTFCNSNLTDVYMLGFYYQGDKTGNYFYGLLQYHFYQTVTQDESGNNVVALYCDYWDWFNDTDKTTVLISDKLATYRYARICARPDGRIIVAWFKTRTDFFKVTNQTQSIISIGTYESKNTYNLNDKSLNTHVTWIEAAREHSGFFSGRDNIESNFISANNADIGYFYSNAPINMGAFDNIDFSRIPDNYYITINGDTIYDYTITDPDSGGHTTINNYITNNYIIGGNDSSEGGGTVNNWNIEFGDFIANITTSIETAITNVFVADVDVINGYNEEIKSAFEAKIPFVSDFKDIFQSLFVDIVDNNFVYAGDIKPEGAKDEDGNLREENILYPSWGFTIDFFGQELELTILDFSMYAEPLYYVRIVVCVFIYVVYFVNLAKALPKLLGNVLDVTDSVSSAVKGGGDS